MVEHLIRTWERANGTWDVTHHRQPYGKPWEHLYDVGSDFSNFHTRKEADDYAQKLFHRRCRKGNRVELESPEMFGMEHNLGFGRTGWAIHNGPRYFWLYKDGKVEKQGEVS